MRKILLSFFIALPFLGLAQSLQLSDQRIEEEATVFKARATVTNVSNKAIQVLVKREIISQQPEHIIYFCWGSCFGPDTEEAPYSITIKPGEYDAENFYGDLEDDGYDGQSVVKYTFFDKNNPSDKVEHVYTYKVGRKSSIRNIANANLVFATAYPNPTNGNTKIAYDLTSLNYATAKISVMNIQGSIVKEVSLVSKKGTANLSTDGLNNGIYLYALMLDGKAVITRKLTVAGF